MEGVAYVSVIVATAVSVARTGWVLLGVLRTFGRPRDTVDVKWDLGTFLLAPEVVLPAIIALWLFAESGAPPYSAARQWLAMVGAGLSVGGLALTAWAWISLPTVGTGHYLLEGQRLITRGAYAVVRNPIYSGAFLIWFGLAAAFASAGVLLLTVAYVIPVYVLYVRAEERMMLSRYGDEYRGYCRRVGAFVPRAPTSLAQPD